MTPETGGAQRAVTLYLVRHGAATGAGGRCIGQCDLPLSPRGRADIVRLAAAWPMPPATRVIASDLARARDSAVALVDAWSASAEIEMDARLREMHFGAWDGRQWADIQRGDGVAMSTWMERWEKARVPDGEGFGDVIDRAAGWLTDTVHDARASGIEELVVVAHAGSIRSLLVHSLGLPRRLAFRLRLDHARASALRISGDVSRAGCAAVELLFLNADRVPGETGG